MMTNITNQTVVSSVGWIELATGGWLSFVTVVGIFLNTLVLIVYVRRKEPVTSNDVFIIGIMLNNILMCVMGFAFPIIAEFSGHWLVHLDMHSCIFEAFVVYFLGMATMYILVAIAVWRYVSLTNIHLARNLATNYAVVVTLICEFAALILALAPLLGWGSYGLESHGTTCGLEWTDTRNEMKTYLLTILVAAMIFPMCTMGACYFRLYRHIRKIAAIRSTSNQPTPSNRERKMLKLSCVFVVTFLVSWTPYAVVSFYVAFSGGAIDPILSRSAAIFAKTQVIWNPILYFFIVDKFRHEALRMILCKSATTSASSPSNNVFSVKPSSSAIIKI